MVRGLYTGASSMAARVNNMNVLANNLANANTTGFKKDLSIYKAHPEMVVRRNSDDGVRVIPLGSYDIRPVVGKLGTGVELNEVYNQKSQGSLRKTDNPLDFAIQGKGYFSIATEEGERYTRNGGFVINSENFLTTLDGYLVLGENGPIRIKDGNFTVNPRGEIFINPSLDAGTNTPVQANRNGFEEIQSLGRLKVVTFPRERYLIKEGNSFYRKSEESGEQISAYNDPTNRNLKVIQGFKETSNVNPVDQMVRMIEVQRAYEASQKTITSSDMLLDKLINNMARV